MDKIMRGCLLTHTVYRHLDCLLCHCVGKNEWVRTSGAFFQWEPHIQPGLGPLPAIDYAAY